MKNSIRHSKKAFKASIARSADSFTNASARLGYGTGNLADGSTYRVNFTSRNRYEVEAMYRSSWICGKAVDSVAEDMTKRGIEIASELEPGAEAQLMALWQQQQIWDKIADTIKWARLYGGAIAVMLIDGQKLDTPLNVASVGRDQFKGLVVLDRWMAQPDLTRLVTDYGPNLGLPIFYNVNGGSLMPISGRIHYSRVIRIDGQDLPYFQRISEMLWGQSVIERLFDRLLAFDSTTQGAAQLVYKAHLRTYKIEGFREAIAMGGPGLEALIKQMEFVRQSQTNEGMTLMDSKDEFEAHAYQFGGLDTVLLQFAQQLSGALDIPLTRLFGQSPAGLNATGESDIRSYYDGINQQQERRLRTGIDVLLQVSHLSQFGKPIPPGTTFSFRPLWQLTDGEKATIAGQVATAVGAMQTSMIIGRQTALKELKQSSKITGVFTNITDETIAAADDDVDTGGELGGEEDGFGDKKTRDADFVEAEHPRNDVGEFATAGAREGRHDDLTNQGGHSWTNAEGNRQHPSLSGAEMALSPLKREPEGRSILAARSNAFLMNAPHETAPVRNVPVNELHAWQSTIEGARLKPWSTGAPPIQVVKWEGRYIVMNGNHRAASAWAAGEQEIPAHLVDLDEAKNQKYLGPKFRAAKAA